MKRIVLSLFLVLLSVGWMATEVQAKPLGAGRTSGMKRQPPPAQAPAAQPAAKPAAADPKHDRKKDHDNDKDKDDDKPKH